MSPCRQIISEEKEIENMDISTTTTIIDELDDSSDPEPEPSYAVTEVRQDDVELVEAYIPNMTSGMQSLYMAKFTSAKISKALAKQLSYNNQYYSKLAFARKIVNEFNVWGHSICLGDNYFFLLMEFTSEPVGNEEEGVEIYAKEMRVADNVTFQEEDMWVLKIIFYGELAYTVRKEVKPKDIIVTWGGRLRFVNNEQVYEINKDQFVPPTVVIWSNVEEPSSLETSPEWPDIGITDFENVEQNVTAVPHPTTTLQPAYHNAEVVEEFQIENCSNRINTDDSEDESQFGNEDSQNCETHSREIDSNRENSKSLDQQNNHQEITAVALRSPVLLLSDSDRGNTPIKPAVVIAHALNAGICLDTQEILINDSQSQNSENSNPDNTELHMQRSDPEEISKIQDQQMDDSSDNSCTPSASKLTIVNAVKSGQFLETQEFVVDADSQNEDCGKSLVKSNECSSDSIVCPVIPSQPSESQNESDSCSRLLDQL